jgi:hypothetical protein
LLLANEMESFDVDERHGCKFDCFFDRNTTPRELLGAGIYNDIAVPLRGGPWRNVSIALLAKAIGHRYVRSSSVATSVAGGEMMPDGEQHGGPGTAPLVTPVTLSQLATNPHISTSGLLARLPSSGIQGR